MKKERHEQNIETEQKGHSREQLLNEEKTETFEVFHDANAHISQFYVLESLLNCGQ